MGRISLQDAIRLGFVKADDPKPSAPASRRPTLASLVRRPSTKPGRHRQVDPEVSFDIEFFVPGNPRTKQRARTHLPKADIVKAFLQARGSLEAFRSLLDALRHKSYTPKETKDWEGAVARLGSSAMRSRTPHTLPVELHLCFVFTGAPGAWPTDVTDPDLDNAEKAIKDALNKVVWKDDRLVVRKVSSKTCGTECGVRVRVRSARINERDWAD